MKTKVFLKKCSMLKISRIDLRLVKKCLSDFFLIKKRQALENF